jgi:3-hydroxybutyrate dehydrogenase
MFAVNVTSAMLTTQMVLPQMKERDWGRIINTASVNSQVTSPNTSGYTASKHAIMGLTRAVALETIMTGVTCNAICPGTVRTNLSEHRIETFAAERQKSTEDVIDEYLEQKMPYHQAMKRFITVEEIAAGAVYLCSDAGAAMRGAAFTIDGGWTIR